MPIKKADNKIIGKDKMPTRYNCVDNKGQACRHFGRCVNVPNKNKPARPMRAQTAKPKRPNCATRNIITLNPLRKLLLDNEMSPDHRLNHVKIVVLLLKDYSITPSVHLLR